MNEITFLTFLPLVGVCFLIGTGLKAIKNDTLDRFIPFLCGLVGGILGIIVFKTIPGYMPAENWLAALFVGIGSGLAATGAHQCYKQFTKEEYYEKDTEEDLPIEEETEEGEP